MNIRELLNSNIVHFHETCIVLLQYATVAIVTTAIWGGSTCDFHNNSDVTFISLSSCLDRPCFTRILATYRGNYYRNMLCAILNNSMSWPVSIDACMHPYKHTYIYLERSSHLKSISNILFIYTHTRTYGIQCNNCFNKTVNSQNKPAPGFGHATVTSCTSYICMTMSPTRKCTI